MSSKKKKGILIYFILNIFVEFFMMMVVAKDIMNRLIKNDVIFNHIILIYKEIE